MSESLLTLPQIKERLSSDLCFDMECLGPELFTRLSVLLPQQEALHISNCQEIVAGSHNLNFKGVFSSLFGWTNVAVECCLFEHPSSADRNCMLLITLPDDADASEYFEWYQKRAARESGTNTPTLFDLYTDTIAFNKRMMLFSSLDFSTEKNGNAVYPDAFRTFLPPDQVKAGLNFKLKVEMENDVGGYLANVVGGVHDETFSGDGLIYPWDPGPIEGDTEYADPREGGPRFLFSRHLSAEHTIGPFGLALNRIGLEVPLTDTGEVWPGFRIGGTITIGKISFGIATTYDLYYDKLSLSFTARPSLKKFLELAGLESLVNFPKPVSSLLEIELSGLEIILNLKDPHVSEIRFSLDTPHEIDLIENVISLKPKLVLRIVEPFNEPERSLEGTLLGSWELGGVDFETSVDYPGLNVFATPVEDETLQMNALLERVVPGLELPDMAVSGVKLGGSLRDKSFTLVAILESDWHLLGQDKSFVLKRIDMEVSRSDSGMAGRLDAVLQIGSTEDPDSIRLEVSARNDGIGSGWQFEGSTGSGQEIPIGELLIKLGHSFGIDSGHPACLESLEFKNLHVSFNTATKDFAFKGEGNIKIEETDVAIEVAIDISHQSDGLAQKRFSGVIKIGINEFDVVFDDRTMRLAGSEKEVDVSTLVASYRSTGGKGPSMSDLVSGAGIPDIETRGAFLARQSKKKKGADKDKDKNDNDDSKWLFGLSLKAGLDLSNIKLPDLPLIGSGGVPKSFKLELQILYPTKPFDKSDVGIIGDMNATGGLSVPTREVTGFVVATSLLMDGKTVTLNLPIKGNEGAKQDEPAFSHDKEKDSNLAPEMPGVQHAVAVSPDDGTKWVKIQKKFGPIHVERVGLKYENGNLFIYLDGDLSASGLTVSLAGLGIDTPLNEFDPHFHISGIGIEFKAPTIEVGAAFLKQEITDDKGNEYTAYAGQAVLRTPQFALSAIGSYANYLGDPSMFFYAVLDQPLGGPPYFFVTGLAVGFGYNRRAIIPEVELVHTYPLVTKAIDGPPPLSDGKDKTNGAAKKTPAELQTGLLGELKALNVWLPPEPGEVFLAIGVKFNSFKLIDSFALVIAQFGEYFQFDLVGVSHLQIPTKQGQQPPKEEARPGSSLAEIYMNWKGVFRPDEGMVGLKAVLAPGSYVFSPDCKLTGGFAYYAWFGGEHIGDFVYTLGGYHPEFRKPDHYPMVERLTLNWILKEANLHLKGQLYYALTSHAYMVGGKLDASMHGGFDIGIAGVDYSADLHISADFLITWEPYHYDAQASIDLHIDLSAHLLFISKHFSLDVGADVHFWGPEFAGEAHIYLKVWKIRHTLDVSFGAGPPKLRPITWEKFHRAFLPMIEDNSPDPNAICGVSVRRGLVSTSGEMWVVNAKEFCLVTDSVIPITQVHRGEKPLIDDNKRFVDPGSGYELELMTCASVGEIPVRGKDRIIVAKFEEGGKDKLHLRIFDNRGERMEDAGESELPDRVDEIAMLKTELRNLWGRDPEESEKETIIDLVTKTLGSAVATDFGIAPMGVKSEELNTVHSIAITRDGNPGAEAFFRFEPVFKKVPAAMWEKPSFVAGSNEEFLNKPDVNPERQLVPGVVGGVEVLPASLIDPSETLPVERGELRYECDRIGSAYRWDRFPAFEAEEPGDRDTVWKKVTNSILKQRRSVDPEADSGKSWKVREDLLNELGMGHEVIHFGEPTDQYVLDKPQIEKGPDYV